MLDDGIGAERRKRMEGCAVRGPTVTDSAPRTPASKTSSVA